MARLPGTGSPYGDSGPLPAQHSDATKHLADVSGPPAPAQRGYGVPMAAPTTRPLLQSPQPAQTGTPNPRPAPVGGPAPAQKVYPNARPRPGGIK